MIYSPSEDSFLILEQVKKYSKNKVVLDMGSGSGILAQSAKTSGAKSVLACDINNESVKYLNSIGIKAVKSNLFSKIKGKFDLIIFNPPYLPRDLREDKESALATTGGKIGDEILLKFIKKATSYLNKEGIILILVSSLTPMNRIDKLIEKSKLKKQLLSSKKIFFEELYVMKLEKA